MNQFKRILRLINEKVQSKSELNRCAVAHRDAKGTPQAINTRRAFNRARLTNLIGMNKKEKADLKRSIETANKPTTPTPTKKK
tara:strand:- start:667 stop:915 length:249 start_codon:yes stop_codon:yes gene_type:complete